MSVFSRLKSKCNAGILETIKQFIKFGIVGVSNTLISLCVYYAFVLVDKDFYLIGNTAGFFVSVINAYYWNNKLVFKKTGSKNLKPFIKALISYGLTFLLSSVLLILFVQVLDIPEAIAPLLNLVITIPLNFLLNKFWAFR